MDTTTLTRTLRLPSLVLFGLAYLTPIIVLGIFGVISEAAGGAAPAAYLVALAAMLLTAHSYGRMAAAFPVAGSAYTYVRRSIDSRAGFLVGWAVLLDYLFLPTINYLVMELLAGISLGKRLRQGRMSAVEISPVLDQVCSALAASHAHGIVHRDVKPENIYLIEHGGEPRHMAEGLDALMRAMVQLPTYLERVMSGGRDMALLGQDVMTQLSNLPAMRLYLRSGARLESTAYWFYRKGHDPI